MGEGGSANMEAGILVGIAGSPWQAFSVPDGGDVEFRLVVRCRVYAGNWELVSGFRICEGGVGLAQSEEDGEGSVDSRLRIRFESPERDSGFFTRDGVGLVDHDL